MERILDFLNHHFNQVDNQKPYSEALQNEFLNLGPLHYFIPETLGGKSKGPCSYLNLVENTAYYSLPLGLTLGITGSLFLLPLIKHARSEISTPILSEFLTSPSLGGIMITEPGGGTDIFGLHTRYTRHDDTLTLNGTKCWGGLTGKAEHWLVAARQQHGERLTKKIHLVYVHRHSQGVEVDAYFDALGLQPITYGTTQYLDTKIPAAHIMGADRQNGLRIIYDTLFRSRLGMAAITTGVCRRLLDETRLRTEQRFVFGLPLAHYDQVQFRLDGLKSMVTINQHLLRHVRQTVEEKEDISGDYTLVNAVKVISSETLQAASDSALQLFAAAGYKQNHLVGRAFVDARPFQIFEGSNDVLYENIYDVIVGRHGRFDCETLEDEFRRYHLNLSPDTPIGVCERFDSPPDWVQREKVLLGQMVAWVFAHAVLSASGLDRSDSLEQARCFCLSRLAAISATFPYCRAPLPLGNAGCI